MWRKCQFEIGSKNRLKHQTVLTASGKRKISKVKCTTMFKYNCNKGFIL